jgi:deoxyribodipyrimidine photo-lyase
MKRALVWFRRDLRTGDQPALAAAVREAEEVVPLFIFDPAILKSPDIGAARVAYLLGALESLSKNLEALGGRLILRTGAPLEVLRKLAKDQAIEGIFFNEDYEPYARERDNAVRRWGEAEGVTIRSFHDQMVFPPGKIVKADGLPYTVFTPFSRAWLRESLSPCLARPKKIKTPASISSDPLPTLKSLGFRLDIPMIPAGERAAQELWKGFMTSALTRYGSQRNFPNIEGTSRLSPHLRFGAISARSMLHDITKVRAENPKAAKEIDVFRSELIWREFYKNILWNFPHVAKGAFRPLYDELPWENREDLFAAWCEGRTGFPIVDAAMRQLNQTGWMHNRLRMITASFLTKDLLVSWQWGERYFMQKLFDGDLAANNGGWQWAASTGTDAQPYFRIFNPLSQAEKFDPEGRFIEKWVPEVNELSYPAPVVNHAVQRDRALQMFKSIRAG